MSVEFLMLENREEIRESNGAERNVVSLITDVQGSIRQQQGVQVYDRDRTLHPELERFASSDNGLRPGNWGNFVGTSQNCPRGQF